MDALILAAGQGSRLKQGRPKCLVELGGRPLIDHQLDALRSAGVERVVVVAGYQAPLVTSALPRGTTVVLNPRYAQTNSLYSFLLARRAVGRELVILNSDVLFHPLIARMVAGCRTSALAYDSCSGDEAEHMKLEERDGTLVAMSKALPLERSCGENVGLIRLSGAATRAAFDAAAQIVAAGGERAWLPSAISAIAPEHPVACLDIAALPWVEIDFPEDLDHARRTVLPAIGQQPEPVPHLIPAAAA
jgi:L-glutamine-phosphate cytidylyltransferase